MDDTTLLMIAVMVLGLAGVGGLAFAFAGKSGGAAGKRVAAIARERNVGRNLKGTAVDQNSIQRRKVADTLKELERKQKAQRQRLSVAQRIEQAGLDLEVRKFWIGSAIVGVVAMVLAVVLGQPIHISAGIGFAAAFGVPRWVLNFLKNRRIKSFVAEFANAVDVIVRGVKSGLPLNDCLRIIAQEVPDPVGAEFRQLTESLKIGIPLDQALKKLFERMPVPEVNFFVIVLTIQAKTGGNLSEALNNLSNVLRDRKRMQGKIRAMSSEAKASAAIIGSLPPAVMLLVYITSPDYMTTLFTERAGNVMLICSGLWMSLGVFVMKKMINFKF